MNKKLEDVIRCAIKDGYGLYDKAESLAEYVVYYVRNANIDNSKENVKHE